MPQENLDNLIERVYNGATLYISADCGILPEFSKFTGVKNLDFDRSKNGGSFTLDGKNINYSRNCKHYIELCGAETICENDDEVIFTKFNFGKGTVYYLNYPLEKNFINKSNAFDGDDYLIYKQIFSNKERVITADNKYLGVTVHPTENGAIAVIINYSGELQPNNIKLDDKYVIDSVILGDIKSTKPFKTTILKLNRN